MPNFHKIISNIDDFVHFKDFLNLKKYQIFKQCIASTYFYGPDLCSKQIYQREPGFIC